MRTCCNAVPQTLNIRPEDVLATSVDDGLCAGKVCLTAFVISTLRKHRRPSSGFPSLAWKLVIKCN